MIWFWHNSQKILQVQLWTSRNQICYKPPPFKCLVMSRRRELVPDRLEAYSGLKTFRKIRISKNFIKYLRRQSWITVHSLNLKFFLCRQKLADGSAVWLNLNQSLSLKQIIQFINFLAASGICGSHLIRLFQANLAGEDVRECRQQSGVTWNTSLEPLPCLICSVLWLFFCFVHEKVSDYFPQISSFYQLYKNLKMKQTSRSFQVRKFHISR